MVISNWLDVCAFHMVAEDCRLVMWLVIRPLSDIDQSLYLVDVVVFACGSNPVPCCRHLDITITSCGVVAFSLSGQVVNE